MSRVVISFFVSVPVLSEHITVVLPRASTTGSFLTMALRLTILATPIAIVIVTATGNPSGIAETAVATATINISDTFSPRKIPTAKIMMEKPIMMRPTSFANRSSLL